MVFSYIAAKHAAENVGYESEKVAEPERELEPVL
jgi:hypothetical protein